MFTTSNASEMVAFLRNAVPEFIFGIAEHPSEIVFGVKSPGGVKAKVGVIAHDGKRFIVTDMAGVFCHWRITDKELIELLRELVARKGDWAF